LKFEQSYKFETAEPPVVSRRNILISGGTSTGKTTFLNEFLAEIPENERLVLIEDTEELKLTHSNSVGMIAASGQLSSLPYWCYRLAPAFQAMMHAKTSAIVLMCLSSW
jgi:type IV secretory pathway ATPase VirB11/archaellum biosynthesis ATPase